MNLRSPHISTARIGSLVAAAGVTLGSVALSGAATAQTSTFRDAHGDMAGHGADIHNVRVVNAKAVRVRVQHADLVRSYKSGSSIKVYLDTDRGERGPEFVFVGGTFRGADYALQRVENWKVENPSAVPLQSSYLMRLDYADDVARIRFSRAALGNPDEVRVAVKTGGDLDGRQVVDWLHGRRDFTRWVARG
ncbi:MAG TPA: hypothetical protein VFG63_06725 [Nocardioidaceae bacterium]|nr:hypothetical protein [Nocardioidaceae bacterium]